MRTVHECSVQAKNRGLCPVLVRGLQKNDHLTSLNVLSAFLSNDGFFGHFSQCNGLIRRCAARLTSVLESCGTPRGDSTYPPLSVFSVVAGDGSGSTPVKKLGANVASSRILLALSLSRESVCKQKAPS